jgi:asparagine synthase (glutamine-hydrolysing)
LPYVELIRPGDDRSQIDDPAEAAKALRLAVEDSIRVRVDTDLTVGVVLSGGLDSSIVLTNVREMHPDCIALTIGAPGSDDVVFAWRLCAELGVPHEVVTVRPSDIRIAGRVRPAVRAHDRQPAPYRTAARDRVSMGQGVEARVPYLDPALVELALRIPLEFKVRAGQDKWIMRQAFADILPDYIIGRPKNPMSHSSGLHERARMYRPLFARLQRSFGYGLRAPVRRDFSVVLGQCGEDVDLALARTTLRPDYSAMEHARDLVGALRWNAASALRSRARH